MQNGIQQRIVDMNLAIIADETQFTELVHEKADTRPGCSDHFRKRFLADFDIDGLRNAILAEVSEKQQKPGKSPFAGIKQLIDQILFHAGITS